MRVLGHPLHPLLVHFPVALWTLATVADGLSLIGVASAGHYAGLCLSAGLVLAVPAMIAGLIDYVAVPDAALGTAQWHLLLMTGAWSTYLIALLTRMDAGALSASPPALSIGLSFAALCVMAAGGWAGGQLVYHHGVAVARNETKTTKT